MDVDQLHAHRWVLQQTLMSSAWENECLLEQALEQVFMYSIFKNKRLLEQVLEQALM